MTLVWIIFIFWILLGSLLFVVLSKGFQLYVSKMTVFDEEMTVMEKKHE
jgi:hypothetical protein